MNKITIGENNLDFRLTIESWKKLKDICGITPANLQQKIGEDMAAVISSLVFYGLSPEDRAKFPQDKIDSLIDLSIANQITAIVENSLTPRKDDEQKN